MEILVLGRFSFRTFPVPKITAIDCVGLVWGTEESLAVCLVCCLPSCAPAACLLNLLEAVAGWALAFLRFLVLGDFHPQADAAFSQ